MIYVLVVLPPFLNACLLELNLEVAQFLVGVLIIN